MGLSQVLKNVCGSQAACVSDWTQLFSFFFFSALLAPASYLKLMHFTKCKVIKFPSTCFQVFEWQPVKKAKYYSFRIHVLDVEEISYLLAHILTSDFE